MIPLRAGLLHLDAHRVLRDTGWLLAETATDPWGVAPPDDGDSPSGAPVTPTAGTVFGAVAGALVGMVLGGGPWGAAAGAGLGAEIFGGAGPADVDLPRIQWGTDTVGGTAPVGVTAAAAIGVTDAIVRDLEREQTIRKVNQYLVGPAAILFGAFAPGVVGIARVWNVVSGGWLIASSISTEHKVRALRTRTDALRAQLHARRPHRGIPTVDLGEGGYYTVPGSLPMIPGGG